MHEFFFEISTKILVDIFEEILQGISPRVSLRTPPKVSSKDRISGAFSFAKIRRFFYTFLYGVSSEVQKLFEKLLLWIIQREPLILFTPFIPGFSGIDLEILLHNFLEAPSGIPPDIAFDLFGPSFRDFSRFFFKDFLNISWRKNPQNLSLSIFQRIYKEVFFYKYLQPSAVPPGIIFKKSCFFLQWFSKEFLLDFVYFFLQSHLYMILCTNPKITLENPSEIYLEISLRIPPVLLSAISADVFLKSFLYKFIYLYYL